MGDLNATVGEGRDGKIVGNFRRGVRNERGQRFVEWCTSYNQVITNTWYKHHRRRRWTWRSPNGVVKNQIDYITINERFRNSITQAKAYPGADCGSDHVPVICHFRVKLKKLAKAAGSAKRDYSVLIQDQTTRLSYAVEVQNRFDKLSENGDSEWENFKAALTETAEEVIPSLRKA